MSVFLKLDEMLDVVEGIDKQAAERMERVLCAAGDIMADLIASHFDCIAGRTAHEGMPFAGTACSFNPSYRHQPLPDGWEEYDDGAKEEWEEAAIRAPAGSANAAARDLVEAAGDAVCAACKRPEMDCSSHPCAAVIADRKGGTTRPLGEVEGVYLYGWKDLGDDGQTHCDRETEKPDGFNVYTRHVSATGGDFDVSEDKDFPNYEEAWAEATSRAARLGVPVCEY